MSEVSNQQKICGKCCLASEVLQSEVKNRFKVSTCPSKMQQNLENFTFHAAIMNTVTLIQYESGVVLFDEITGVLIKTGNTVMYQVLE